MNTQQKYNHLIKSIAGYQAAAVAFSGGVDSSFLCHAAVKALGRKTIALSLVSPLIPEIEVTESRSVAQSIGIEHVLVELSELPESVRENPPDRCYFCKQHIFTHLFKVARDRGFPVILDGSNYDDLVDYRPGTRALKELEVFSPLQDAGLRKEEIRELSRQFGLPTWNKPAFACLASRIPYGERIDNEKLRQVEKGEDLLRSRGFRQFRVRLHGELARIEIAPEERKKFFNESFLDSLSRSFKNLGFTYVAFELEGYSMGSLNRTLGEKNENSAL